MKTSTTRLQARAWRLLAALSDSTFRLAMTLLLLELHVPAKELIYSEGDLRRDIGARKTSNNFCAGADLE